MQEQEFWTLHSFFVELAEYEDVDLEGTEYEEYGVKPNSIHKQKSDHKETIRILTEILEGELDYISELETWREDYDDYSSWAGRYGRRTV